MFEGLEEKYDSMNELIMSDGCHSSKVEDAVEFFSSSLHGIIFLDNFLEELKTAIFH